MASRSAPSGKYNGHRKLALVMGNGNYKYLPKLKNPRNDAEKLSQLLEAIGFYSATPFIDQERKSMKQALLHEFEDEIKPNDIVLLYFSGHGVQWEDQNYLLPTDIPSLKNIEDVSEKEIALKKYGVNAQEILNRLYDKKPYVIIFLLDCCREYILSNIRPRSIRGEECNTKTGNLAWMHCAGSIIGFACGPGTIVDDRPKENNSLFVKHLLRNLKKPNKDIVDILREVTAGVMEDSNGQQYPFISLQLIHTRVCLYEEQSGTRSAGNDFSESSGNSVKKTSARHRANVRDDSPERSRSGSPVWGSKRTNRIVDIPMKSRWSPRGITIAGGNGYSSRLKQLNEPHGIDVADDGTVYVADSANDRIVAWKQNQPEGILIAGGNGRGSAHNQLDRPVDVILDEEGDSLIICDNRRVLRWHLQKNMGETLINDIYNGSRIAIDDNKSIYVSNFIKGEVKKYKTGDKHGILVAGGYELGDGLNQLNYCRVPFVDQKRSVYVPDGKNNRVMKWGRRATEGVVVAGGKGKGNGLDQLCYPQAVFVDTLNNVYVADSENHRVMRWCKGDTRGEIIVGGNGPGNKEHQLNLIKDLSFDQKGNLYVVDYGNNRVQLFQIL